MSEEALEKLLKVVGENIYVCYQCGTCTGGCPVGEYMEYKPREVIVMLHLGFVDRILESNSLWVCTQCNTCTSRCPRGVPVADIIATLRSMALKNGHVNHKKESKFYKEFIHSIRNYGRVFEFGVIAKYSMKAGLKYLLRNLPLGIKLIRRGKLALSPTTVENKEQIKTIFKAVEEES